MSASLLVYGGYRKLGIPEGDGGGEHSFDYAVISADPEYFNQTGIKDIRVMIPMRIDGEPSTGELLPFDRLAYAEYQGAYTTAEKADS